MADDPGSFDHHSPDFAANWRDIYAKARAACPVLHSDLYEGYGLPVGGVVAEHQQGDREGVELHAGTLGPCAWG